MKVKLFNLIHIHIHIPVIHMFGCDIVGPPILYAAITSSMCNVTFSLSNSRPTRGYKASAYLIIPIRVDRWQEPHNNPISVSIIQPKPDLCIKKGAPFGMHLYRKTDFFRGREYRSWRLSYLFFGRVGVDLFLPKCGTFLVARSNTTNSAGTVVYNSSMVNAGSGPDRWCSTHWFAVPCPGLTLLKTP